MSKDELIKLFNQKSDFLNMGSAEDAPSTEWIEKAEKALSVQLPDDYKWFLNTFGGGDICGEEIYSIYCMPFNEAVGGDIVYQNTIANNNIQLGKVVLSNTDFGEEFYFEIKDMKKVYISFGDNKELYATNFIDYLYKRLMSYV